MRKKIYALICAGAVIASLCGCSTANQTLPPFGEDQSMWDPSMNVQAPTEEETTEAVVELPVCTYEIDGGTVTFTGTGRVEEKTSTTTPQWIEDIGGADKVTAVVISEGITQIGNGAFKGCSNLESIVIPKSVETIPSDMVRDCTKLTSVEISEGVKIIGKYAFYGCVSLESIDIPSTIVEIGDHSFFKCNSFTEVTIPDSVTTLSQYAFSTCEKLEKITVGKGVKVLTKGVFSQNKVLTEVVFLGVVEVFETQALADCTILEELHINDGLTRMDAGVLGECNNLKKITIPASVDFIATDQFKAVHEDIVIYGVPGSKAEEYATQYEIPFVSVEE